MSRLPILGTIQNYALNQKKKPKSLVKNGKGVKCTTTHVSLCHLILVQPFLGLSSLFRIPPLPMLHHDVIIC